MAELSQLEIIIRSIADTTGIKVAEGEVQKLGVSGSTASLALAGLGLTAGLALVAGLGKSVEAAAKFQEMLSNIQGNTGMTNAEVAKMRDTVISMATESGVPMEDLATGFMHIMNEGYSASQATTVLRAAMEAAVTTGANAGDVANSLALIMHDFGANANQAGDYMAKMLSIAQHGNITLQDLATNFSILAGVAHGAGIGLNDVGAAYSNVTQVTGDAAEAQTQVKELLVGMIAPTSATRKEISALAGSTGGLGTASAGASDKIKLLKDQIIVASEHAKKLGDNHKYTAAQVAVANDKVTTMTDSLNKLESKSTGTAKGIKSVGTAGIDLSYDFSAAGLKAKGFGAVMDDVQKATHGNIAELKALFPNVRAFEGALTLLADKGKAYREELKRIQDATGETLKKQYTDRLQEVGQQWKIMQQNIQNLEITIGTGLLPIVTELFKGLQRLGDFIKQQFQPVLKQLDDIYKKHKQDIDLLAEVLKIVLVGALVIVIVFLAKTTEMILGFIDKLFALVDFIKNVVNEALKKLGTNATQMGENFKIAGLAIVAAFNDIKNAINGAISKLDEFISKIPLVGGHISIPHFAGGVTNFSGGMALVGEKGPELVNLPRGSSVIPNNQIGRAGGGSGIQVTQNIYNNVDMTAAMRELGWRVRR
jgi:hypothetical protein